MDTTFSTDLDLLHWEPNIFRDAAFASQQLLSGSGELVGTSFTISAGSLADAHVAANHVIVLSGDVAGSYPIIRVNSATQLTLSVLYDGLFPEDGESAASPVGSAAGLTFAIRTFWPQRSVVTDLLLRSAGLDVASRADAIGKIINAHVLRRPCTLGALQMIYSALAAASAEPANLSLRADLYERLYRRSLAHVRLELDLDGDGKADAVRRLNVVEMVRA